MATPLELTAAAVLFDMDGTLVDSTAVVEMLWTRFCDEYAIDAAELLAFSHGRRTPDIVARFLPDASEAETESVSAELEARELAVTDGIVEIPGAARLLATLAVPWAVVTSAPRELAVRRMVAAGLPVPDVLVPADEVPRGKPAPDGYLRAAELFGVDAVHLPRPRGRRARRPVGARLRCPRRRRRRPRHRGHPRAAPGPRSPRTAHPSDERPAMEGERVTPLARTGDRQPGWAST